jgi:molybdopterin-guanine dinucleotide biosynthesis adapter protein
MRVFSVSGFHHTGKTTVVCALAEELRRRSYRVQTIKDIHNGAFTMEKPGSNSWRHWEASGETVIARGLSETYQVWHRQLSLSEMLSRLDADFVIVEGMHESPLPRIVAASTTEQLDELVDELVFAVSGILSETIGAYRNLPVLHSECGLSQLADLVEEKVFPLLPLVDDECCRRCGLTCRGMTGAILRGEKTRSDCLLDHVDHLVITLDGEQVPIVPFVQDTLRDIILGYCRHLKGFRNGELVLRIPAQSSDQ